MAPRQAFSWSASWSSWVTMGDGKKNDYEHNLVKMEAFPRSQAALRSEKQENFPVVVQVTAPAVSEGTAARAGVDVVAVLDVSGSMKGERLEDVKEAMKIVIGKLGSDDRLSVVSFATDVHRLTELTYMSEHGRGVAREMVDGLVADGSTNMGAALREGAMILRDRKGARDDSNGRVGCMMFLSDGTNDEICKEEISGEFPAHTFGLSADHNPKVMRHIADKTSATYSFVNCNEIAKIKDALELFISGLTSVVATAVQITVKAHDGAAISSIRSGGYAHHVASDHRVAAIDIHDMYAGERKRFVVYLRVAEGGGGGKTKLLTVGGSYRRSNNVSQQLRDVDVSVVRPRWWCSTAGLAIQAEVAAELARIKLEDGVAAVAEAEHPTGAGLQEVWNGIMASTGVPEATLSQLQYDVDEMMKGIEDPNEHKKQGLPYMLSWLTCHKWQRATTKNSPSKSASFQPVLLPSVDKTPTTTPWWKTMTTWWSRYALLCGMFLLAAAFIYFAVAGVVLMLGPSLSMTNYLVKGNGNSTMIDIPRQSGWAKMEHQLEAVITKAKADGETSSLFRRAASSGWSMDAEIDRYLYMAIVHATVLRSQRRGSTGVISGKVVRREVERYLRRMPKAMEVVEIPSFEGTTVEETKNGMNRYLYSTIVQSNIKEDETTPTPPMQPDHTGLGLGSVSKPELEPGYKVIRVWSWMTLTTSMTWSWTTSTASYAWNSSRDLLLQLFNPSTPKDQNLLLEQKLRDEQETSRKLSEELRKLEQQLQERMEATARAEWRLHEQAEQALLLRQQVEEKEKVVVRLRSEAAASAARLVACVEKEVQSGGCCERVRKLEAVVRELRG